MKSAGTTKPAGSELGTAMAISMGAQALGMAMGAVSSWLSAAHQKAMIGKQLTAQETQLDHQASQANAQKEAAIAELGEKETLQNDLANIQQKVNSSATERAKTEGEQTVAKAELTEQEKTMQAGRLNTTDLLNNFFDSRNQYRYGRPA